MMMLLHQAGRPYWAVSFSGAGHLLAYHLGAVKVFIERNQRIGVAAGSSSGAIAAAILCLFPHRLDQFTDKFLHDRGRALSSLEGMLQEELPFILSKKEDRPVLMVAATACKDGSMELFKFDSKSVVQNGTTAEASRIMRVIEASCKIPVSFHPIDMFATTRKLSSSSSPLSYPDQEGIEIDGRYFVDGGIAAPAPPAFLESEPNLRRIVVSPISCSSSSTPKVVTGGEEDGRDDNLYMIRPVDTTFALPGGDWKVGRCGTFRIRPSVQNLRAMIVSLGVAPPGVLNAWYERGKDDANIFLDSVKQESDN